MSNFNLHDYENQSVSTTRSVDVSGSILPLATIGVLKKFQSTGQVPQILWYVQDKTDKTIVEKFAESEVESCVLNNTDIPALTLTALVLV